jgi:ketosteroid isomerase-like protein
MKKRTCEGCGQPLEKPRPNQRYHNQRCIQLAYRKRKGVNHTVALVPSLAPLVVLAGVDTLYVNVYYADPEKYTRALLPLYEETQVTLDDLQQRAKTARTLIETPWSLLDQSLYSRAHGSKELWTWILRNDYVNIQIGKGEYRGLIARVRLSAEYLWKIGYLVNALAMVNKLVNTIFEHEMYLVPGAIDLCADVAYWSMSDLDKHRFLSRAKKCRPKFKEESLLVGSVDERWNGSKLGTLYFGEQGSPVHGKVYDKVREIKDRGYKKKWFFSLWGRTLPTFTEETVPVNRVELSATREALSELGIDTCADLYHNLKGLWAYLVGSETVKPWLRYTVPTDDPNRARWPIDPTWKTVQHAFDTLSEEGAGELIRLKKQEVNIERTTASLTGYLTTLAAHQCIKKGYSPQEMDLSVFVNDVAKDVETVLEGKETDFQEQIAVKQERYYLRKAATEQACARHAKSLFATEQEAI